MAVLEYVQIVWTGKLSQTNKSSDVQTGQTNFSTTNHLIFVHLERRFFPVGKMPDDLSVQMICSSSSVKMAMYYLTIQK